MPVPKKKMSKSKRDKRKFVWKQAAMKEALKALSVGKIILKSHQEDELKALSLSKMILKQIQEKPEN
uniref:Ribosomal protein L32 n=1 Tax=Pedinomonas tuberculata TaxID=160064 RepID=A0A097KL46_9CHLO|nr:ribosomal protein L32 [Pedinomonas tuberculata]AIT93925.1 ribosomal protein L32 [Pedinomonas tuberculata]